MWTATGSCDENGIIRELTVDPPYDNADPHVREQIDIARNAIERLIGTGALGGPGESYAFSISGRANPGHRPPAERPGETDGLAINVVQLTREEGPSTTPDLGGPSLTPGAEELLR